MLKNLFSKLKKRQEMTNTKTTISEEKKSEKKENDL